MIGIRGYNSHSQGESHKASEKPCQDYSFSIVQEGYAIAIVSDGHGGERYFRSDVGSKLAVEVTVKCLTEFAKNFPVDTFSEKPFTAIGIGELGLSVLGQLTGAIVVGWRNAVKEHAEQHPLTDAEQKIAVPKDEHGWERTYGCTLIATLRTPQYWLAFQIGDGKCVAIGEDGCPYEPIPWDDRCFLNRTTSICDTAATEEFRYCFGGKNTAPVAIFLGSDGIDDSFGGEENLYNFYVQLAKGFAKDGHEATTADLETTLPVLSKRGSQDDMSVAGWYDERLAGMITQLSSWQEQRLMTKQKSLTGKIASTWHQIIFDHPSEIARVSMFGDLMQYGKEKSTIIKQISRIRNE